MIWKQGQIMIFLFSMNSDSEDESRVASEKVGDYDSSDTDSLELEPRVSGPGNRNIEPVGDSLSSNLTSLIGSFISNTAAQRRRPSNLSEDFEFISQEELNEENILKP